MKRLIWKELYEQRYVPVAYAALLTSILIVWFIMGNYVAIHGGQATDRLTPDTATDLLWLGISWSGLLFCSSTISSEIGGGTLNFLSALPVSRARIWWTKITAGLLTSWLSILLMLTVYALCVVCVFGPAGLKEVNPVVHFYHSNAGQWLDVAAMYTVIIAISTLASTLTDRPVAAVGISLLGGISASLFISRDLIAHLTDMETNGWECLLYGYVSVALLVSSLLVFKNGFTLRTARRFIVGGISLIVSALIPVAIIMALGYLIKLASLQIPHIPVVWTKTEAIPGSHKKRTVFEYIEIDYGRVKPGTVCHGTFWVGSSDIWMAPVKASTHSPNMSAEIIVEPRQHYNKRKYYAYNISFDYRPKAPTGDEVRQIDLYRSDGKLVETIVIKAHKTTGLFVPVNWIPHQFEWAPFEYTGPLGIFS